MKKLTSILLSTAVCASLAGAQSFDVEFEAPKDTSAFNGVEWGWNADLTFNYQGLDNSYTPNNFAETKLQAGFTLPTANLDINAKVLKGFNVKLETMLSSHHHHETFVKGGYASIDSLDFISPDFASEFMKNATIKVGVDDINFGDNHFRRTDNADVFKNPFVHNMAVEAYMAAAFIEVLYRIPASNSLVVVGVTNGQVDPNDVVASNGSSSMPAIYGKYAFDKQLSEDTRFRISESIYYTSGNGNNYLYMGDKAGTVSTDVFGDNIVNWAGTSSNDFASSWNAMSGYDELTASMTNIFLKHKGTELYGTLELAESQNKELTHYAVDLVQRFGGNKFYVAGRYENATVEVDGATADQELAQYQLGLGWFISKNAMAKVEYIKQERENIVAADHLGDPAEFDGFMISTALSF